ncbi:MAG: hypothetical protein A2170_04440 [Deltaproteobacteria bacterium RBG_13_53_10]|nr:MAG: hypothetical protein A2170_04440 [Deltaproteobacteria bacterium RBG_13_53_10]
MEKDRSARYAQTLEKTIQNNHHYLKEKVKEFHEMCLRVTPERNVPPEIVIDIREYYKDIRSRLGEIKAIQQLLQGKYRQYYHRDPLLDKEITEFSFVAKNCYSKFEYIMVRRAIQKRDGGREEEEFDRNGLPSGWFRSKENQIAFISNLRALKDLDYEASELGERRRVTENRPRGFTLFLLSGDEKVIETFQAAIRLREHDVLERYENTQLRGLLAHLREIDSSEVEKKFKEFIGRPEFLKLKCLLLPIHPERDFEGDILETVRKELQEMREGEVRTLSV